MSFFSYKTGTIAVTNGSTAVVGTSTLWSAAVTDGDQLWIFGAGTDWHPYEIQVTDDTHITLDRAYAGTTGSALAYMIFRSSVQRDSYSAVSKQLSDFLATYRNLISVTGSDRYFTLDKTLAADNAGIWYKQGGTSKIRAGLFGDNDFEVQYLVTSTWTKAFGIASASGIAAFGNTTDASSTGVAAATFAGGVGIAKKLYVGDAINGTGINLAVASAWITIRDTSGGTDAKAWNCYAGSNLLVFRALNDAQSAANTWMYVARSGYAISYVNFPASVVVSNTTASTSTTTGALTVAGGLGVAGKGYFGNEIQGAGGMYLTGGVGNPSGIGHSMGVYVTGGYGYVASLNNGVAWMPMKLLASALSIYTGSGATLGLTQYPSGGIFIGASPSDPGANNLSVQGQVKAGAGTTSLASLNIPHGSAPTSPVNGDIWTTSAGLYVRINGATVGPLT